MSNYFYNTILNSYMYLREAGIKSINSCIVESTKTSILGVGCYTNTNK